MNLVIGQSPKLKGKVKIPSNKSHSFRALIMAGMAEGTSRITRPAESNDWMLATGAFEMFGAVIKPHGSHVWDVTGTGGKLTCPDNIIQCGNSGIILRFFSALSALGEGYTVLTGDHSLRHIRPVRPVIDAINQLGAWAVCTRGGEFAPVVVKGRLQGGTAEVYGADSQPVSAMLIASAMADAPTEILVKNPGEKPWIGVTLDWLKRMGIECENENYEKYTVKGGEKWQGFEYQVPLDWSAALYPIVAALVTGESEVTIPGMDYEDTQGDKELVEVLRDMGGDIAVEGDVITARSSRLQGRVIDCNNFIDQIPLVAVVGALAEGETRIVNAEIGRQKECDRLAVSELLLKSMGAEIEQTEDGLVIQGGKLRGAVLESYKDHRMVMAMSVAAMAAEGESLITDCECVRKTFAKFPERMAAIGADIRKD